MHLLAVFCYKLFLFFPANEFLWLVFSFRRKREQLIKPRRFWRPTRTPPMTHILQLCRHMHSLYSAVLMPHWLSGDLTTWPSLKVVYQHVLKDSRWLRLRMLLILNFLLSADGFTHWSLTGSTVTDEDTFMGFSDGLSQSGIGPSIHQLLWWELSLQVPLPYWKINLQKI